MDKTGRREGRKCGEEKGEALVGKGQARPELQGKPPDQPDTTPPTTGRVGAVGCLGTWLGPSKDTIGPPNKKRMTGETGGQTQFFLGGTEGGGRNKTVTRRNRAETPAGTTLWKTRKSSEAGGRPTKQES